MRARFSAPFQTGPVAHPASCTMGTGSFPEVKRPGRGVGHPPPSSAEVKGRVELYLYSPYGPSWSILGRPLPLALPKDIKTTVRLYCMYSCGEQHEVSAQCIKLYNHLARVRDKKVEGASKFRYTCVA